MSGFIEGVERNQVTLFPERLEDWIGEDHLVRLVDLFVVQLDPAVLGFKRAAHSRTGRPGYHPSVLLRLFIYCYLNRVSSSRRLEREAGRNVEVMWLIGRLVPDHKTIADFRRENGAAIRKTCTQFVELYRRIGTLKGECVAIDGSKFKAVNNRDKNFTKGKIASRLAHLAQRYGREKSVTQQNTKTIRAVLYIRLYSGDRKKQITAVPEQRAQLEDYCKRHGWHIVGEYVDTDGAVPGRRPVFDKMVADLMNGTPRCERVVVHSYSRFTRDYAENERSKSALWKRGIKVVSTTGGFSEEEPEVVLRLLKMLAEEYSNREKNA